MKPNGSLATVHLPKRSLRTAARSWSQSRASRKSSALARRSYSSRRSQIHSTLALRSCPRSPRSLRGRPREVPPFDPRSRSTPPSSKCFRERSAAKYATLSRGGRIVTVNSALLGPLLAKKPSTFELKDPKVNGRALFFFFFEIKSWCSCA